ncbi:lipoprotein-releasing ABC transporter permease subunit [Glaciecola sp. XM2]|jgi:lipoprotein-releasing system permease protein|uniref:lipoprotein-releasing ABC transporter permease subunit n=1 Tax=Glaciecola sp. XM2 TaxID=1914931 RepID=UPI001BDEFE6A|nr:lipoprotein-releasing ABC transporter permease subunit [Glaciecola sp. XM2]MBT1449741.1 lipoprotein-releasing ABC transporter permease subunit [Glaciecola sp. XM2]
MSVSQFIAWRYSRAGGHQSFVAFINRFSVIGIALGIAALIIVLSVMNGLEGQLKTRILGILPHIVVEQNQGVSLPDNLQSQTIVQVPYTEREVVVQSRSKLKGLILQGVDAAQEQSQSIISQNMVQGDYMSLSSGSYNAVISQILASQLNVRIGQRLRVISTELSVYTPLGKVPSQRLVTIAGIFSVNSEMDDKVILMHIDDVARLLRSKPEQISDTRLYLKDAFEFAPFAEYLEANDYAFRTWRERQGALFDAVKMEKNMMVLMLLLVIAVAAFNVVSALVMVVSEKRSDIAILQTQGLLRIDILRIFLLNGVFNGLKGVGAGVVLGLLCAYQLNTVLSWFNTGLAFGENGAGLPVDVQWHQIAIISISSVAVCALVSLYPAFKAASIKPADSLRSE